MAVRVSDHFQAFKVAAAAERFLASKGLRLDVVTDPDAVRASVVAAGKPYLTPWLDPVQNDFSECNFFWLIGSDCSGPVMLGGGRLDCVGHQASAYYSRLFRRSYGPEAVLGVSSELSAKLRGRVCYLGDLYSRAKTGLARRNVQAFLCVANYIARVHFAADAVFSFMRLEDVERGSADVNGFCARIYDPITWAHLPAGRSVSEILVYRDTSADQAYFDRLKRVLESHAPGLQAPLDGSAPAVPGANCQPLFAPGA